MAGEAQIGFNIDNVPFGEHSILGPARKKKKPPSMSGFIDSNPGRLWESGVP
jgi:hypothetical protein